MGGAPLSVATACLLVLALAALLALYRVVAGPRLVDRVIALDLFVLVLVSGLAVRAGDTGDTTYAVIALVVALFGVVSTVTVARFIEARGPS